MLHPKKVGPILLVVLIFGSGILITSQTDHQRGIKFELNRFIESGLDHCEIKSVLPATYPGGRGKYNGVFTKCSHDRLPMLLDSGSMDSIGVGAFITKQENSAEFTVTYNNRLYKAIIRNPSRFDKQEYVATKAMIFLAIVAIIVTLILPVSRIENM